MKKQEFSLPSISDALKQSDSSKVNRPISDASITNDNYNNIKLGSDLKGYDNEQKKRDLERFNNDYHTFKDPIEKVELSNFPYTKLSEFKDESGVASSAETSNM